MASRGMHHPLSLYNTFSGRIEPFEIEAEPVTVYVCGITPYDTTHVGHAFTYVSFDVLIRYLEYRGHAVRYVQNVTDIDDDILRQARKVGEGWKELGNRWTAHFIRDMQVLNVRPPDYFPRATDVIPEMLRIVQRMIDHQIAYEAGGSVYFSVDAWPQFGALCRIPREEMLVVANERGNNPDDPNKRDPLDFVLWQTQAPGEPAWESPWGAGRPGWHIECSTMATRYLGERIDIHGGGGDLAFPHHEAEIAQTEAATGQIPFVRLWMHTAMVRYQGEKMSKSLGNLVMVDDLLQRWPPDAIRLLLACHRYRQPWEFDEQELHETEALAQTLRRASVAASGSGAPVDPSGARSAFEAAMDRDLDTPEALRVLRHLARETQQAAQAGREVGQARQVVRDLGRVFGLRLDADEPEERVLAGWNRHLERFR